MVRTSGTSFDSPFSRFHEASDYFENWWLPIIKDQFHFEFEPIVNLTSGEVMGFEALLRGWQSGGFRSIPDVFDTAFKEKNLFRLELALREKLFAEISNHAVLREKVTFINVDQRVILMPDYKRGETAKLIEKYQIPISSICFEISERYDFNTVKQAVELIKKVKSQGYKIALDDFGTGYSGMQQLYNTEADYIKIDRFFVSEDESAFRKRLFIANIVHLAHLLGITVIAEGVENEREYYLCKELGCDYVQGYFVKSPSTDFRQIVGQYSHIQEINDKDRRKLKDDRLMLKNHIEPLPTLKTDSDIEDVFNIFRDNPQCSFIPILNSLKEPIGIIRESGLKQYVYSPYGREVLKRIAKSKGVMEFLSSCPKSELRFSAEKIMNTFSVSQGDEGIMMTEGGKYVGFLFASDLLKILNEKNLEQARDQNPLTKLNGNQRITDFINRALTLSDMARYLVYFDFDNFKPFNDKYGFRRGDRAILLFSDILKKATSMGSFYSERNESEVDQKLFLGHVGGDDFFLGSLGKNIDEVLQLVKSICTQYCKEVADLYDPADREAGKIRSIDREGNPKDFSLLTVSAGILELSQGFKYDNQEEIGKILAQMKKSAKGLNGGITLASILP